MLDDSTYATFLNIKVRELEKRLVIASGQEWSGSGGWERTIKV